MIGWVFYGGGARRWHFLEGPRKFGDFRFMLPSSNHWRVPGINEWTAEY